MVLNEIVTGDVVIRKSAMGAFLFNWHWLVTQVPLPLGQDKGEVGESLTLGTTFKGIPKKNLTNECKSYSNAIFYKSKFMAKIHHGWIQPQYFR